MADLVVIGYPDEATASKAYAKVQELQQQFIVDGTAARVTRSADGKLRVETESGPATIGAGAVGGALWGALIGLLFLVPLGGMLFGAVEGALIGKLADLGIDDGFRSQVQDVVKPGTSAVVIMFDKMTPDKTMEALEPFGGKVLKTSLSHQAEEEMSKELGGA